MSSVSAHLSVPSVASRNRKIKLEYFRIRSDVTVETYSRNRNKSLSAKDHRSAEHNSVHVCI